MERLCHVFRIVPGREEEYVRRHVEIWPEMVEAMKAAGFADYTLFRRGTDVIAVCECHPDVETCFARFAEHGVGERWQASMEGLVVGLTDEPGSSSATRRTGTLTDIPRPKVGVVSCYFPLFEKQMPPGFRQDREATARGYADLLARDFDVVDAGTLASDADGERANALLRDARVDAVVFAPSMAAPPSYAARALAELEAAARHLERPHDRPAARRA